MSKILTGKFLDEEERATPISDDGGLVGVDTSGLDPEFDPTELCDEIVGQATADIDSDDKKRVICFGKRVFKTIWDKTITDADSQKALSGIGTKEHNDLLLGILEESRKGEIQPIAGEAQSFVGIRVFKLVAEVAQYNR